MRVLSCRIPAPAFERLRVGEGSVIERAQEALDAGFQALDSGMTLPLSSARWKGFTRPLALTVDGDTYVRLRDIAGQSFDDDMRDAAGWLIARGVGVSVTNVAPVRPVTAVSATAPTTATKPTPIRPAVPASSSASTVRPVTAPASVTTSDSEDGSPPPAPGPIRKERVIEAIRARATPRAALPPDDSAPDGDELRRRREAVGISQRDLAAASGLSRGLVAEVERGRRRHVMTRARIAETLASVAAEKGISLDTGTSVAV
jgi:DNA-binding transcriptional regulator YiaG